MVDSFLEGMTDTQQLCGSRIFVIALLVHLWTHDGYFTMSYTGDNRGGNSITVIRFKTR